QGCGVLDGAVSCYEHALRIKLGFVDAIHKLGNARRAQGHLAEAVAVYGEGLRFEPEHAQLHLSRAFCWLQMGGFERGWPEYEWRLTCSEYALPAFPRPLWDGSPLRGRGILLYADHGLGDALQFIRFAPLVHERGGRVILACRRPIARLLARCRGVDSVVSE